MMKAVSVAILALMTLGAGPVFAVDASESVPMVTPDDVTPQAPPRPKFDLQTDTEVLKLTDDLKQAKRQLKAHPEDPEANFLVAAAYSRTPDLAKAYRYIKRTKELLKQTQDFEFIDRTNTDYEALLEENPESTIVLYRLAFGYYLKAYSIEKYPHHFKSGPTGTADEYYQKAKETMAKVIALNPQDIWARNYYGYFISENGKDWSKAVQVWEDSLAIDSDHNAGAYFLLSQAYLKLGDLGKSLMYGARALEIQQTMGMTLP